MANSSTPFGFLSYGHRDGSAPTMGLEEININSSDANPYFTGDLVIRSSAGNNTIAPYLGSTAASLPSGVFAGCKFYSAAAQRVLHSRHFPGSVGANATGGVAKGWIISDPEMQFTAVSAGTFVAADVGFNAIVVAAQSSLGNTANGQSAMIVSTAIANSASYPWRIVNLYADVSVAGTPGAEAGLYNRVVLAPNAWERHAGTIGVST